MSLACLKKNMETKISEVYFCSNAKAVNCIMPKLFSLWLGFYLVAFKPLKCFSFLKEKKSFHLMTHNHQRGFPPRASSLEFVKRSCQHLTWFPHIAYMPTSHKVWHVQTYCCLVDLLRNWTRTEIDIKQIKKLLQFLLFILTCLTNCKRSFIVWNLHLFRLLN